MHIRKHLAIAAAATALLAGTALPASADDTAATFTLTGGGLSFSVQPSAALTNASTQVDAFAVTGSLGGATVTDARGGIAGWVVSGVSTAFTGVDPDGAGGRLATTSASVKYSTPTSGGGEVTKTGTVTVTPATAGTDIGALVAVLTATEVSGEHTAAWNPLLTVNLPAGALIGQYSGTVTTSIV